MIRRATALAAMLIGLLAFVLVPQPAKAGDGKPWLCAANVVCIDVIPTVNVVLTAVGLPPIPGTPSRSAR